VIGEASRNIERSHPDFAAAHPELPLAFAYEMRNAFAHGYFNGGLNGIEPRQWSRRSLAPASVRQTFSRAPNTRTLQAFVVPARRLRPPTGR